MRSQNFNSVEERGPEDITYCSRPNRHKRQAMHIDHQKYVDRRNEVPLLRYHGSCESPCRTNSASAPLELMSQSHNFVSERRAVPRQHTAPITHEERSLCSTRVSSKSSLPSSPVSHCSRQRARPNSPGALSVTDLASVARTSLACSSAISVG